MENVQGFTYLSDSFQHGLHHDICRLLAIAGSILGNSRAVNEKVEALAKRFIVLLSQNLDMDEQKVIEESATGIIEIAVSGSFHSGALLLSETETEESDPETLNKVPPSLFVLQWLSENLRSGKHFRQLLPYCLTLIDHHDPKIKLIGVKSVHALAKLHQEEVEIAGLDGAFFESIRPCLTYHSNPDLFEEALNAIWSLEHCKSASERARRQKTGMEEGVIRGLTMSIGAKKDIAKAIILKLPEILVKLNILCISYLEPLLGLSLEILKTSSKKDDIFVDTCKVLQLIVKQSWPRETFIETLINQLDLKLQEEIRVLVGDLRFVCGDALKPQLQAIKDQDETSYKILIEE
ncbi:hypothetical protein HDU97_004633 [Phlyctochytrium planicorne]|nr:hypothetical protein HDU97_004633 [Phlyctochytrium planicorne]